MKHWFFIALLMPFCIFASQKPILSEEAIVKILVGKNLSGVLMEVKGSAKIFNTDQKLSIQNTSSKRLWLHLNEDSFRWGNTNLECDHIAFIPNDKTTCFLVDGIQYKGTIYIFNLDGKIAIVNGLKIEEYLESILNKQVDKPLASQALDALTIATRTNVVNKVQKLNKNLWHFDAAKEGFKGFGALNENREISTSIRDTKSLILQPNSQAEELGLQIQVSRLKKGQVDDKPTFILPLALDYAKHQRDTVHILKTMLPNCSIEKFDHKLMMEATPSPQD